MMGYFLAFFGLVLGLSVSSFFGLPILMSFIFSYVPMGYTASLVRGFIPARCTRRSIVRCGNFDHFAISVNVSPSMLYIIDYFYKNVKCLIKKTLLLNRCEAKNDNILLFLKIFSKTLLIKCLKYATL